MLKGFEGVDEIGNTIFPYFDKGWILIVEKFLFRESGNIKSRPFGQKDTSKIGKIWISSDSVKFAWGLRENYHFYQIRQ